MGNSDTKMKPRHNGVHESLKERKTATGQRVAKRINDGDFPYNIYDATGRIVKPETKKAKKKA